MRFIGVDEVSRTGGHQYFTIVTDLEAGSVIWVAEGKRAEALALFFEALGARGCKRISIVVSDLGGGYLSAISRFVPHARHVLDRGLPEGPVRGKVDGERRRDHLQQHTGRQGVEPLPCRHGTG